MLDAQPVETTLYSLENSTPKLDQRQGGERHLSLLRVGSLMIGDRRELCLIRNISAGGMLIRVYSAIAPGTELSIELKQGEPVRGSARWAKDDCVGVEFDRPIDVIGLISQSMEGPRPRQPRIEVQCVAWVRDGASVHRARAVNISQGGLKIECAADIAVGSNVVVSVNGLAPAPATVRWHDDASYGLTFNRALALPALVGWLHGQQGLRRAAG